jgi:hypothetical protein
MARLIAYAFVDASVEWTGRQSIFVGDEKLGPVPCLALARDVAGELEDVLIFHCNDRWEVLGMTGAETLEAAKAITERAYRGITAKWIEVNVSAEEAQAWIHENYDHILCLFCGRTPQKFKSLVTQRLGAICNDCIDEFHEWIHRPLEGGDGG